MIDQTDVEAIPSEIRNENNWILWRLEQRNGDSKTTKVPYQANGGYASTTNDATWASLDDVMRVAANFSGIGFVFNGTGVCGVDLDHCRSIDTGMIDPWAVEIIESLDSYTEVSQSGTGVHVIARARLPGGGRKRRIPDAQPNAAVEMYDTGRYFVMTGRHLAGTPTGLTERQGQVEKLYGPTAEKPATLPLRVPSPALGSDSELIERATNAANGAKFSRLWHGDTSGHGGDDSAADLALCNHLAFWTDCDPSAVDRLFRKSGLYREKWDRQDYRDVTIAKAVSETRTQWPLRGGNAKAEAQATEEPWPDLIPLNQYDRPVFPVSVLPPDLANWCTATATSLQVPVDLPAMLVLPVLAAACARKWQAVIRPGWEEPLNLYCLTAMESGNRKSAAFSVATSILWEYERQAIEDQRPGLLREQAEYKMLEARVNAMNAARATGKNEADRMKAASDFERAMSEFEKADPPAAEIHLVGDDVTPEKIVQIMSEQHDRFACFSAEGGLLQTIAGSRYNKNPNYDALLKAHSGDSISQDRKGSGKGGTSVRVAYPALTLGLSVQPEILRQLVQAQGARGVGLLARFLFSVPVDNVGARVIRSTAVPADVTASYRAIVGRLLSTPMPQEPTPVTFSVYADDRLAEFEAAIEPRLGPDGDLRGMRDWAGKLAGAVARIATLLAIAEQQEPPEFVEDSHVGYAVRIAEYLLAHAKAALGMAETFPEIVLAQRILIWANRHNLTTFTVRDALRGLSGDGRLIQRVHELQPGLDVLLENGHIRAEQTPKRDGPGRPKSPSFTLRNATP